MSTLTVAVTTTIQVPAIERGGGLVRRYSVGFYGVPGQAGGTAVHIHDAATRQPACGSRVGPRAEFQWCSWTPGRYVDCKRCMRLRIEGFQP